MNNFWQRIQRLPWLEISLVSLISLLIVIILELSLIFSVTYFVGIRDILTLVFFSRTFATIIPVATAVGMGALSVYLLEWWGKKWLLNTSTLWALIFSLLIGLLIKSFLPLPALLISLSQPSLIGIAIGVFWKGRPYWKNHY
ncbi:MAG: peptide chain release factor 1 [Microcoleaceae cyanobacterium]